MRELEVPHLDYPGKARGEGVLGVGTPRERRGKGREDPNSLFLQEVHLHSLHLQEPAQEQDPSRGRRQGVSAASRTWVYLGLPTHLGRATISKTGLNGAGVLQNSFEGAAGSTLKAVTGEGGKRACLALPETWVVEARQQCPLPETQEQLGSMASGGVG